jgi:hypothetical protein
MYVVFLDLWFSENTHLRCFSYLHLNTNRRTSNSASTHASVDAAMFNRYWVLGAEYEWIGQVDPFGLSRCMVVKYK